MTVLEKLIVENIRANGPMPFDQYMEWCMRHPQHGYYITRDPLGADGDFTTGPEISQMFGEMIALWCVDSWMKMSQPKEFLLVEGGPGRGTLMEDVLRTVKVSPAFMQAARVILIEKSPALREKQKAKLQGYKVAWAESLDDLPPLPLVFFSNELLDTFAIRRFLCTGLHVWEEQVVVENNGKLGLSTRPLKGDDVKMLADPAYVTAPVGAAAELSPDVLLWMGKLYKHLNTHGGASLTIDYGYEGPLAADTVQAISKKKQAGLMNNPGEADITAYVDFGSLRRIAEAMKLKVHPLRLQRDFLLNCGVLHRAKLLKEKATPEQQGKIDIDLERLTSAEQMGILFKVFCVTHSSLPAPLGF
jgi:NADH dehydrogenase [ubiquinone] 1 alpha subcomplex assembly factor 7